MQPIDPKLDNDLSSFICGWDAYEKMQGEHEIIDMYLSERVEPRRYADRQEILKDIELFLSLDELKNHKQISRKLLAHKNFLLAAMGETIPFQEYFENTMGLKPILFSEQKIESLRLNADCVLQKLGMRFEPGIHDTLYEFEKKSYPDDIIKFMKDSHESFYKKISSYLDLNVDFSVDYSILPYDSNYYAWISGNGKNYSVQLNPEKLKSYRPSQTKTLAVHELTGHAVNFSLIRHNFEKTNTPEYMGYITVHEPIQFAAEGLASAIEYFYPEYFNDSLIMQATEITARVNMCSFNNAAYLLSQGNSFDECVQYSVEKTHHKKDFIAGKLNYIASNKTLGPSYGQIYGIARETFVEIAGSHPDKNSFLKSVYHNYLMPEDIMLQSRRPIAEFI